MKAVAAILLLALAAVCSAQTPPRPNFPEDFAAEIRVEDRGHQGVLFGEGGMAYQKSKNRGVEDFRLHVEGHAFPLRVFELARYDLHEFYELDSEDPSECRERNVNGSIPAFWGWVKQANFSGVDYFHHVQVDLWRFDAAGIFAEVGVRAPDYNVPVFLRRGGRGGEQVSSCCSCCLERGMQIDQTAPPT